MDSTERSSVPALVLLSDIPGIKKVTPITNFPFLVGRGNDALLKLHQFRSVSRKQFTIEKTDDEWTIRSVGNVHTNLNNQMLLNDVPEPLKCSDVIELSSRPIVRFQFKCSPNQIGLCCKDFFVDLDSSVDFLPKSMKRKRESSVTLDDCPLNSSFSERESFGDSMSIMKDDVKLNIDSPLNPTSLLSESTDSKSLLMNSFDNRFILRIDPLIQVLSKYVDYLGKSKSFMSESDIIPRLSDELELRIDCTRLLAKYYVNKSCNAHSIEGNMESLIECKDKLRFILNMKPDYSNLKHSSLSNSGMNENLEELFLSLDNLLIQKLEEIVFVMNKLPNHSHSKNSNDCSTSSVCICKQNTKDHISTRQKDESKTETASQLGCSCTNDLKPKIQMLETRAQYLEMKLSERNALANELEKTKEENDALVNKLAEINRVLATKEIMELEFKYLKEVLKLREEDKRSKDCLQQRIDLMREENANLLIEIERMKNQNTEMAEKYEKLEDKFNKVTNESSISRSCHGANSNEESCCEVANQVKSSVINSFERDLTCGICSDILIEATATNCSHVFCSYCLNEWKKMKKECPFCRTNLVKECKVPIIDEYVLNLLKSISDKKHAERVKVIEERKAVEMQSASAKRPRTVRARRPVRAHVNANSPAQGRVNSRRSNSGFPADFLEEMAFMMVNLRPEFRGIL